MAKLTVCTHCDTPVEPDDVACPGCGNQLVEGNRKEVEAEEESGNGNGGNGGNGGDSGSSGSEGKRKPHLKKKK